VILVVDDDPRILSGVVHTLTTAGYNVRSADGGAAALALLEEQADITTVVSDVLMPDMIGPVLVEAALALRPDLHIVYMSGDVGETPPSAFGTHPVLSKPFTQGALIAAVRGHEVCR
jgi:CheY-like chemotaxis protein